MQGPIEQHAVIDRIEGDLAVLVVGEREHEVVVPLNGFPAGASEGVWLRVRLSGSSLVSVVIDSAETERMRQHIANTMARLHERDVETRDEGSRA